MDQLLADYHKSLLELSFLAVILILLVVLRFIYFTGETDSPQDSRKTPKRYRRYKRKGRKGKKRYQCLQESSEEEMESGSLSSNWKLLQKKLKGDSKVNGSAKVVKKRKVVSKKTEKSVEGATSEDKKPQGNEKIVSTVTVGTKTVTHKVFTLPDSLPHRKPAQFLRYEDTELHSRVALAKPAKESAKKADAGPYVAIDCEFVGVGHQGSRSALARVSIVNYYGAVLLDKFVKPKERVTDWRTWVSGVSPKDMKDAITFEEAQKLAADIFKDRIVVGHAVYNDLKALMLSHPKSSIRDTSNHKPFRKLCKGAPGLKRLSDELLHIEIQTGEHSSVEDAQATMLLFRLNKSEFDKTATTGKRKRRD